MLHQNAAPEKPAPPGSFNAAAGQAHSGSSQDAVHPNRQILNQQVLIKLLRLEPESYENLVRVTGWSPEATHSALLQLIASGEVRRITRNGQRFFDVKED
ncbi:hypothetical protein NU688_32715 [Variovorax sp. ZS18.2.2]|uniref:hypothetical protein n=1 Tax=Variovorax sp. ZS18.2.2 TaxID=2971255 RepID=UPI002151C2DB|nr:hypothetical protein [Variovorax sp. ZS18.2.2]MCR6480959.1 hypothetical protein [Variovorax sp. ZS18.2.2]